MAITMERLRGLLEAQGLHYFVDPSRNALFLGINGLGGTHQFFVMHELEGRFIQFRTLNYHSCPDHHPSLHALLELLAELNYRLRFVKFSRDPLDGEIVVYGDVWLMDGDLSNDQFAQIIQSYMSLLDYNHPRIRATLETGTDPGEMDPADVLRQADDGSLPPELQSVIDDLLARLQAEAEGKDDQDGENGVDVI
jgi:hypothetical protein